MKKYLSVILAVLMVLSSSVLAAPVAVQPVETANEVSVQAETLYTTPASDAQTELEDEEDLGVLVLNLDLEENAIGTAISASKVEAQYVNNFIPADKRNTEGFPADMYIHSHNSADVVTVAGDDTNKYIKYDAYYRWPRVDITGKLPAGTYTLKWDIWMDKGYNWAADTATGINYMNTSMNLSVSSGSEQPVKTDSASTFKFGDPTTSYSKTATFTCEDGAVTEIQVYQSINGAGYNGSTNLYSSPLTFYVDNVKLYYKAPPKVTFAGESGDVLPSPVAANVGKTVDLTKYAPVATADDNVIFKGWSLTEGGEVVNSVKMTGDITVYAVYEEGVETVSDEYGYLAYFIDFDVAENTAVKGCGYEGGTGLTVNNYTTATVPAISGMPPVVELEAYGADYKTDGDNLVMFASTNYPRWWLAAYAADGTAYASFPKGTYTVEYVAKGDTADLLPNAVVVFGNPTEWNNGDWVANVKTDSDFKTTYSKYVTSFTYDGSVVKNSSGTTVKSGNGNMSDMSTGLQKIGFYSGKSGTNTYKRYYKYAKIWYIPSSVKVTFDANGKTVTDLPASIEEAAAMNFAVGELASLADVGTARFAGWSTSPDGDIITDSTMNLAGNTTFYAIWDENYYASDDEKNAGELVFHMDYNNITAVNNLTSQANNYGTYGSAMEKIWEGGAEGKAWIQGSLSDTNYSFGTKYGSAATSYSHPDNEFIINTHRTGIGYPKLDIATDGHLADGIYTMFAEVSLANLDNIKEVQYGAYAFVDTSEKTNLQQGAGTGKKLDIENDGKVIIEYSFYVNGTHFGDTKFTDEHEVIEDSVKRFGFNFTVVPEDSTKVIYATICADNFKVYYKPYEAAPLSSKENSIRVTSPAGIRFKAAVANFVKNDEALTEYGFIVAREAALEAAGIDVADFTDACDVKHTKGVAYGTVDGEKVEKIFEQGENATYFAAIIYNIPADKYDENLVVRPYLVLDGVTTYGEPMVNNIKAVAEKLSVSEEYESNSEIKTAVDKILNGEKLD